jgi:hypothetical protein
MYENRTMKPVEIVLQSEEKGLGGGIEGVNLIEVHCMHVWKYQNETTLYKLIYMNEDVSRGKFHIYLWEN